MLEFVEVCRDFCHGRVEFGEDPLVLKAELFGNGRLCVVVEVHEHEARSVPNLVGKVAGGLDLFVGVAHIVSGRIAGNKRKAQGICAVFGDDFERIDAVAERFGHLASLLVAHQSMDKNRVERCLAGMLQTGEDHARYPERDDVVAGD